MTCTDLDAAGLLAAASEVGAGSSAGRGARPRGAGAVGSGALRRPDRRSGRRLARWWQRARAVGGEGTPGVQDFCLGEIALARGTGVSATANATGRHPRPDAPAARDLGGLPRGRGRDLHRPPGREAVAAPAGRTGSGVVDRGGRPDHRPRGRWPGARGRRGQDHRGRPRPARAAGRGRAAAPLRGLLAHRRVRAAHRDRPGRGRRRGLGRGDRGPGRARSSRPATPTPPPTSCAPIAFGWLARPAELLALLLEHRDAARRARPGAESGRPRSPPTCSTRCAGPTCPRWRPRRCSTSTSTRPPSRVPVVSPGSRAWARSP